MDSPTAVAAPEAVRLTAEDFMILKRAGAFRALSKVELLDGELFGTPRIVASAASLPNKLRSGIITASRVRDDWKSSARRS